MIAACGLSASRLLLGISNIPGLFSPSRLNPSTGLRARPSYQVPASPAATPSANTLLHPRKPSTPTISCFSPSSSTQTSFTEMPSPSLDTSTPFPDEALPTLSGYLPISASSASKLFFCYYEARSPSRALHDTPVLLWLNGGPGCSSMIGNFYELGPYIVQGQDGSLTRNEYSWNSHYGVLFIDNPIGTGFSIAASDAEIPLDQAKVADHLIYAFLSFFNSNQELLTGRPSNGDLLRGRGRPLFLTGESYAGKYVPALACSILDCMQQPQQSGPLPFAFKGIAVGNGFTDPRTQVQVHAEVMLSFGMLDEHQAAYVDQVAQEVVALVDKEEWVAAHEKRTAMCEWIEHTAGIPTLLDIRRHAKYHATENGVEYLALFLNRPQVKAALKADPSITWQSCRPPLRRHMAVDTMKPYKHLVERLLEEGVPTLLFQGMYDAKDGPLSSERWMKTMHSWRGLSGFLSSPRKVWRDNKGRLAGYTRSSANLTHTVVIGAGHQVPADQPENALQMIETWVESQLAAPPGLPQAKL